MLLLAVTFLIFSEFTRKHTRLYPNSKTALGLDQTQCLLMRCKIKMCIVLECPNHALTVKWTIPYYKITICKIL